VLAQKYLGGKQCKFRGWLTGNQYDIE